MRYESHYRALERMYLAAPINRIFEPRITVSREMAEIEMDVDDSFFHA
ncbi:MAG: thioesterase, partial [Deltaproteobacteria bacterium]|nr:thioesterase [Deltaproteobacteria bacterium]MBW2126184.1 thioesterase [Deltaproteobacteria bacterium]